VAPAIFFGIKNLGLANDNELFVPIAISTGVFLLILVAISPLLLLSKRLLNSKITVGRLLYGSLTSIISLLWYLQFALQDQLIYITDYYNNIYINIFILIILAILIAFISLKININIFILIFISFNIIYLTIQKTDYISHAFEKKPVNNFEIKDIAINPKNNGINVYYVIADGLTSLERIQRDFKVSIQETEDVLVKNQYFISKNAKSSYNITHLTLASIFYANYPVNENSKKYIDRSNFFPNMLNSPTNVPLLTQLKKINYQFIYVGNRWGGCIKNEFINCIDGIGIPPKFYLSELVQNYSFSTFFNKTLLWNFILSISRENIIEYQKYKNNKVLSMNDNDAIGSMISLLNAGEATFTKNSFFFIHHLNPHPPILNEDCSPYSGLDYNEWTHYTYAKSVTCTLRRIREFVETIQKTDPNAMVIIQGDHGPSLKYDFEVNPLALSADQLDERFSIFNAIKLPKICSPKLSESLGNVESIRLAMDCLTSISVATSQSKHYAGIYESHPDFGRVFRIIFKTDNASR
jgi:hypothetical protein